jgi:hypothetical protein
VDDAVTSVLGDFKGTGSSNGFATSCYDTRVFVS